MCWIGGLAKEVPPSRRRGETYGSTWTASFAKSEDCATVAGLSACRMSLSSENHLFPLGNTAMQQFKKTYGCPTAETDRLFFLDCVMMFDRDGSLLDDKTVRSPRNSHAYQILDIDLLDQSETQAEVQEANAALRKFLGATWHGNSGARRAEMMASAIAFGGRDVGVILRLTRQKRQRADDARPRLLLLRGFGCFFWGQQYGRSPTRSLAFRREATRI